MPDLVDVRMEINGITYEATVEPRLTLADFIRVHAGLTGTHLGCEHGMCGACTVLLDGEPIRSCIMFAVQAQGVAITTVEGLSDDGSHPVQRAFWENHGLQCGFCTPGFLLVAHALLVGNPDPTDDEIRVAIQGNICRCTGYQDIVTSIRAAAKASGEGGS
ncbi:MAG: (2Fe-2S)-binding protein [Carbonactinosporaceae bacterium]